MMSELMKKIRGLFSGDKERPPLTDKQKDILYRVNLPFYRASLLAQGYRVIARVRGYDVIKRKKIKIGYVLFCMKNEAYIARVNNEDMKYREGSIRYFDCPRKARAAMIKQHNENQPSVYEFVITNKLAALPPLATSRFNKAKSLKHARNRITKFQRN